MRKYGVNWLWAIGGTLVFTSPLVWWMQRLRDCIDPPVPPRDLDDWLFQLLLQPVLFLSAGLLYARTVAKQRERHQKAAEGTVSRENEGEYMAALLTPERQRIVRGYGGISAVIGGASLAAHLFTGRMAAWEVAVYAVGVPLCSAAGCYLVLRSKTQLEPLRNVPTPVSTVPDRASSVTSVAVAETPSVLHQRQGRG